MTRTAWFNRASTFVAAVTMACFGITSMASAQTITNTGPDSTNSITTNLNNNCSVTNNNNVSVSNSNTQTSSTGNATSSDNTTAGLSWDGWTGMDPATAQASGESYASWWNGVMSWLTQRDNGAGWNSNDAQLSWSPSSSDWTGMDPMTWQQNGQSFQNWWNGVQSYMNGGGWSLTWPSDDTGAGSLGGATSGDATNVNNVSFNVSINNSLQPFPSMTGGFMTGSCGASAPAGGQGGGSAPSAPMYYGGSGSGYYAPTYRSGSGSGYSSRYYAPATSHASTPAAAVSAPSSPSAPSAPSAPSTPVAPVAPAGSSISNTGPDSHNYVTSNTNNNVSVTNNNNVSVSNSSNQSANSGNASSYGNTTTGGGGSGDASNGNGAGYGVGITN